MNILLKKNYILIIAGIIWGLTGFTVEIISSESSSLQLIFRLILISISSILILSSLDIKIYKQYYLSLTFLLFYLFIFIFANFISDISLTDILRVVLLFLIIIVLYILLSNKNSIFEFLKGIYFSLVLLVSFYLISINFSQILQPSYRLFTGLNPNGIGIIAIMAFILSYYNIFNETFSRKKFINKRNIYLLVSLISFIVVIATKSRTALILFVIAFIMINIYFKNKQVLMMTFFIGLIVVITQYDIIESVLRLNKAQGYSGSHSIYNLTGRTDLWIQAISVIENNFLLGVGSSNAWVLVDGHKGTYHNAYIQNFVTVGFLGTIPLLYLVGSSLKNVFFKEDLFLFKTIFLVGFASTFVESRFFNFGSPGNLLFLISLLYLSKTLKYKVKL